MEVSNGDAAVTLNVLEEVNQCEMEEEEDNQGDQLPSDETEMKSVTTELLPVTALGDYCDLKSSFGEHEVHDGGTIVSVVVELDENGLCTTTTESTSTSSSIDANKRNEHQNVEVDDRSALEDAPIDQEKSNGFPQKPSPSKVKRDHRRRRRSVLTLQQKLDVIRRIKEGEKVTRLAVEYGVGKATVSDLKHQEDRIAAFVSRMPADSGGDGGSTTRKTMRRPQEERVERVLHLWLKTERAKGVLVTGSVLMEMAKTFHRELKGEANESSCTSFKASTGWLQRFKRRNGIKGSCRKVAVKKTDVEGPPETDDDVQTQLDLLRCFVRDKCVDADRVYVVDKMRLHWRALPLKDDCSTDCIQVLGCMNTTGSHRLRLALFGHPGGAKLGVNVSAIPFRDYGARTIDANAFAEWFHDEFVTAVSSSPRRSTLLLVGAFTSDGPSTLQTNDGAIRCMMLSSATSFVTKVGSLSMFEALRCNYRRSLVSRVIAVHQLHQSNASLLRHSYDASTVTSVGRRSVTLKDAGYMLNDAWRIIDVDTVRQYWTNTLRYVGIIDDHMADTDADNKGAGCASSSFIVGALSSVFNEACELATALNGVFKDDVNEDRVTNWLAMDAGEPNYDDNDVTADISTGVIEVSSVTSNVDAYTSFVKGLDWLERQPDCNTEELQMLWKLQNIAAAASRRNNKQK